MPPDADAHQEGFYPHGRDLARGTLFRPVDPVPGSAPCTRTDWRNCTWPRKLIKSPELAVDSFRRLTDQQARRALTLLAPSAGDDPKARSFLEEAVYRFPKARWRYRGLARDSGLDREFDTLLSPVLAEADAVITSRIVATCAPMTPERASWLDTYAIRCAQLKNPRRGAPRSHRTCCNIQIARCRAPRFLTALTSPECSTICRTAFWG